MSWQSDLHAYTGLMHKVSDLEASTVCLCVEFYKCERCKQIDEAYTEARRLMNIWDNLWATKLYRICQGQEPVTPVHFEKEATHA